MAAVENTTYNVTYTEGGVTSTVEFKDPDQAQRFVEALNEPYIASLAPKYQAIPGPGAGPAPGSIGFGISELLTGALVSAETSFESLAIQLRLLSQDKWVEAASAKDLNDAFGTVGYASAATLARLAAGIYEGATFIARPRSWGALVALPMEVAANPAGYAAAVSSDLGGLVLEGIGGFIGGYGAAKAINYSGDLLRGIYNRSEYANLQKIHPLEPDAPRRLSDFGDIDFSANDQIGSPSELKYTSTNPAQVYRGEWSTKPMYSSLIPVFELDEILFSPALRFTLNPAVLGAITSIPKITPIVTQPVLSVIQTEAVVPKISVSSSTSSFARLQQQVEPITSLADETLLRQQTRLGVAETEAEAQEYRTIQTPLQMPVQEPAMAQQQTPIMTPEQAQEQFPVQVPVQEQTQVQELTPVSVVTTIQTQKTKVKLPKLRFRRREVEREEALLGVQRFEVRFGYVRGGETKVVNAESFHGALVKALSIRRAKGQPREAVVRRL
jgi:hypothetical protein